MYPRDNEVKPAKLEEQIYELKILSDTKTQHTLFKHAGVVVHLTTIVYSGQLMSCSVCSVIIKVTLLSSMYKSECLDLI